MAYRPATVDKFCNWTFVKESDLPDGQKLLGCSRCKGCWYRNRECQTKHWPYHKKSCRSLTEEQSRELLDIEVPADYGETSSVELCVASIIACLDTIDHVLLTGRSGMLLHGFRELKRLFIEEDPQDDLLPSHTVIASILMEDPFFWTFGQFQDGLLCSSLKISSFRVK
jgi:hypothetical protein